MVASRPGGTELQSGPGRTVSEVMRTDFRSCNASTTIAEVAAALRESRCPILAVTQAQVPIGLVTEHALANALAEHGADLSGLTAGDIMTARPATIAIDAPEDEAAGRFAKAGGHLLAVDSDGLLQGIVTLAELGPNLAEPALRGFMQGLDSGQDVAAALRHAPTPAEEAREADPTSEIKSSKSQEQPHPWDSPTGAHPEPLPLVTPADLANPMLKVSDVMTRGLRTCSPASTVLEAVLTFRDADCGVIPITEEGRPLGVLTDRDVALALAEHDAELARLPVSDLMTGDVITIAEDEPLDSAVESLGSHGLRRLLVVDSDGRLSGILSWTDLVPHLSERGLGHAISRIVDHR